MLHLPKRRSSHIQARKKEKNATGLQWVAPRVRFSQKGTGHPAPGGNCHKTRKKTTSDKKGIFDMSKKIGRPTNRVTATCKVCGGTFTKRPSELKRRPTCSIECGAQARGLKKQWQNTASQLQAHAFMYANQLPTFDSICGTFRLHSTENAFYETLDDGTVLRYELTADGRLYQLEDISEVDPDEVPGSAVG